MLFHLAVCFSFYFFVRNAVHRSLVADDFGCSLSFSLIVQLFVLQFHGCCRWRPLVSRLLSNLCCRCSSLSRCLNIISLSLSLSLSIYIYIYIISLFIISLTNSYIYAITKIVYLLSTIYYSKYFLYIAFFQIVVAKT